MAFKAKEVVMRQTSKEVPTVFEKMLKKKVHFAPTSVTKLIVKNREAVANATSIWMSSGFVAMLWLHWAQLINLVPLVTLRWDSADATSWLWLDPMGSFVKQ